MGRSLSASVKGTAYPGVRAQRPPETWPQNRPPTVNDYKQFEPLDLWWDNSIDEATGKNEDVYILASKRWNATNNTFESRWIRIGDGIETLTGDSGGAVGSTNSNINTLGGTLITTVGTPASSTMTFNLDNGTNGQVIIGSTAGSPAYANITSVDNTVDILNGPNSIDLSVVGGGSTVTVQTTDATPTALVTLPVDEARATYIRINIVGSQNDYSATLVGTCWGGARRTTGGAATLIGSPVCNFSEDYAGSPSIDIDVSGNNLRAVVTGVAVTTINWRGNFINTLQTA